MEQQSSHKSAMSAQNQKLKGSLIASAPEIEGAQRCKWMVPDATGKLTSPMCPNCFALTLLPVRQKNYTGKAKAPKRGLIRLGTNREIVRKDYEDFIAGHGTREDGGKWSRPDFTTRKFFLVTRGLEEMEFYSEVVANPRCTNLQVSVDIIREPGRPDVQVPSDARLKELLALPKTLFRLKPVRADKKYKGKAYLANVEQFTQLRIRLAIPAMRVLETPLRLGDHTYQTETPFEAAGWASEEFMRCNSACGDCQGSSDGTGENRVLGCAATENIVKMLERVGNVKPLRKAHVEPVKVPWKKATREALVALGGQAHLQDVYEKVRVTYPGSESNSNLPTKVRANVQALAKRVGAGIWKLESIMPESTLQVSEVGRGTAIKASAVKADYRGVH